MHSRALLAILILGCSSPANKSNANKPSGTGGAPGHIMDAGDTTACPIWPQEKLFPTVGPFFFGPDLGPCNYTETDRSLVGPDRVFTVTYTYDDSGQPVKAVTPTNMPNNIHIITYTYKDGKLQSDVDFAGGLQSLVTFRYGTDTAGYTTQDPSGGISNYDYTLDAQGYPQTISFSTIVNGQRTVPTDIAVQFEYEYVDCRIQRRVAYKSDFTEVPDNDAQFTYDAVGHLIDINSSTNDFTYDYSCWAPADASTDGG
jgi:hypothetical protein